MKQSSNRELSPDFGFGNPFSGEKVRLKGSYKDSSVLNYKSSLSTHSSPLTLQKLSFPISESTRPGIMGLLERRLSSRSTQSYSDKIRPSSPSEQSLMEPSFITPQSSTDFLALNHSTIKSSARESISPNEQAPYQESSLESVIESFEKGLGPPSVVLTIKLRGSHAESFFSAFAKSMTMQALSLPAHHPCPSPALSRTPSCPRASTPAVAAIMPRRPPRADPLLSQR